MSSKHRMVFLAGLVCTVAAFTSGVATAQGSGSPCTLLTQAQIDAALGATVGAGQPIGTTGCSWTAPGQPKNMTVTVSIWPPNGFGTMPPMPGLTKTELGGVGDGAFYATIAGLTSLSVKKGNKVFVLHLYGVPGDARQMAVEKTLAAEVLARL